MAGQQLLYFGGVAVKPAGDIHVLESVGDGEIARCVQAADVTRVQPTICIDG